MSQTDTKLIAPPGTHGNVPAQAPGKAVVARLGSTPPALWQPPETPLMANR